MLNIQSRPGSETTLKQRLPVHYYQLDYMYCSMCNNIRQRHTARHSMSSSSLTRKHHSCVSLFKGRETDKWQSKNEAHFGHKWYKSKVALTCHRMYIYTDILVIFCAMSDHNVIITDGIVIIIIIIMTMSIYTVFQKVVHQLISKTQSILNGFSKIPSLSHSLENLGYKRIIKDFTTPKMCPCSTLWNINFQKLIEPKHDNWKLSAHELKKM